MIQFEYANGYSMLVKLFPPSLVRVIEIYLATSYDELC